MGTSRCQASGLGIQEGHRLIAIEGIEMPGASTVQQQSNTAALLQPTASMCWEMWPKPRFTKNVATSIDLFF